MSNRSSVSNRRVVFVNRYFYPDHSATSQILTDLAFHLASREWEVTVLTSRQLYQDPRATLAATERTRGVNIERLWSTRFGRANLVLRALDYLTFYASARRAISRHARTGGVIVAKTDPPLLSVVAARACAGKTGRLMNWLQDLFPEVAEALGTVRRGAVTNFLRRLRDKSLRRATINVVIGERMKAFVAAAGAPVVVRDNWADDAIVPLRHDANPLRREWELGSAFVVGYSGNLGRAHEFDTVLHAAEILKNDRSIRFLIIGSGPQMRRVEDFVAARKLDNVQIEGYQPRERLTESLGAADVHLVTLNPAVEGFIVPSKFYGVAAAGRATIYVGSQRGDIAEIVKQNDCGVVVDAGDAEGLAAAIQRLAADRARIVAMGRRARELYEQRYSAAIALAHWEEILETVSAR